MNYKWDVRSLSIGNKISFLKCESFSKIVLRYSLHEQQSNVVSTRLVKPSTHFRFMYRDTMYFVLSVSMHIKLASHFCLHFMLFCECLIESTLKGSMHCFYWFRHILYYEVRWKWTCQVFLNLISEVIGSLMLFSMRIIPQLWLYRNRMGRH